MSKKVLIIDDDPTSNTLVGFLLKTNGFDTFMAKDGEEGMKIAAAENPDLIVLDVLMPNMDGYTFLRKLKQLKSLKIPPVIMLTSREKMEEVFKMEGVAAYFLKPLETDKFLQKVKQIVKAEG